MNIARMSLFAGFASVLCVTLVPWVLLEIGVDLVYAQTAGVFAVLALGVYTAATSKKAPGIQMAIWAVAFFTAIAGALGNESVTFIAGFIVAVFILTVATNDTSRLGLGDRAFFGGATLVTLHFVPDLASDGQGPLQIAVLGLIIWLVGLFLTQVVPETTQSAPEESEGGINAWKRSPHRASLRREA